MLFDKIIPNLLTKSNFPKYKDAVDEFCHWLENNILRQKKEQNSLFDCFASVCIERGKPRGDFHENVCNLARSSALTWRCCGGRFVYTQRKRTPSDTSLHF